MISQKSHDFEIYLNLYDLCRFLIVSSPHPHPYPSILSLWFKLHHSTPTLFVFLVCFVERRSSLLHPKTTGRLVSRLHRLEDAFARCVGRVTQALTAGVVGVAVVADTEDVPAPRFVVLTARPDTAILEVLLGFCILCVEMLGAMKEHLWESKGFVVILLAPHSFRKAWKYICESYANRFLDLTPAARKVVFSSDSFSL